MTISVRESGMPQIVSKNSPSTNVLPSTSTPSATKKGRHGVEICHRDADGFIGGCRSSAAGRIVGYDLEIVGRVGQTDS